MGFFDDLSKKASETYRNTAEKTNKITREMKLKSLINEDKSKIEKLYSEIGKKVYENRLVENETLKLSIDDECEKIDILSKEILDMNIEMLALKDMKKCPNCYAEISLNARYCPSCGAFQEIEEYKNEEQMVNNEKNESNQVEESVQTVESNSEDRDIQNENRNEQVDYCCENGQCEVNYNNSNVSGNGFENNNVNEQNCEGNCNECSSNNNCNFNGVENN